MNFSAQAGGAGRKLTPVVALEPKDIFLRGLVYSLNYFFALRSNLKRAAGSYDLGTTLSADPASSALLASTSSPSGGWS